MHRYSTTPPKTVILLMQHLPVFYFLKKYSKSCKILVENHWFLAQDVTYTSRAYATMSVSVCLSVTEVHRVAVHAGKRGGVISTTTSRAMLATARPSCNSLYLYLTLSLRVTQIKFH